MLYSIDRFEGDIAVLVDEDENVLNVRCDQLPSGAESGAMLRVVEGCYVLDKEATLERRKRVLRLQDKLRRGK